MNAADALDAVEAMWVLAPPPHWADLVSMRPGTMIRCQFPPEIRFIAPNAQAWMRAALVVEGD